MTDEAIATSGNVSGQMFLYREPELLSPEKHGDLGFTPAERPFDFIKNERVLPLTMSEFSEAQRYYPIIFSNLERPVPLAAVGLLEEVNLFVGDDGKWDAMCYLPNYLRCYPFALAKESDERIAIVVDRAASSVSENPQYPFFRDGQLSEQAEALTQLCGQYDADRQRTNEFCKKLVEMELLTPLGATYTPDGESEAQPLAEYIGINVEKLNELTKDQVFELHAAGYLSALYLQLYSLENWRHLMARREKREKGL